MTGSQRILCPECGSLNPANSSVCRDCGAPLTAEIRTPEPERETPVLVLVEAKTGEEFAVCGTEARIGQDEPFAQEYFSLHRTVSHTHCRIFWEDGRWKISEFKDEPSMNETWIRRSPRERPLRVRAVPQLLFDGSVVYIADCEFNVRIEQKPAEETDESCPAEPETPMPEEQGSPAREQETMPRWVVICPVCGAKHPVDGPEARIPACGECDDPLDKRRIAVVRPVKED